MTAWAGKERGSDGMREKLVMTPWVLFEMTKWKKENE